jgi:alanyl-tRNA synthetase
VVVATFENRPVPELRTLAEKLKVIPGLVAVLASFDGLKMSLVVTSAEDTDLSARDLLVKLLALLGGRGGGDRQIAQGGGPATLDQFRQFPQVTNVTLSGMIQ